jgi:hypothetical protein
MTNACSDKVPFGYAGTTAWSELTVHQMWSWLMSQRVEKTTRLSMLLQGHVDQVDLPMTMPWPEGVTEIREMLTRAVRLVDGRSLYFEQNRLEKVTDSPAGIRWRPHLLLNGEVWVVPTFESRRNVSPITQQQAVRGVHTRFVGTIPIAQLLSDKILQDAFRKENVTLERRYGTPEEARERLRWMREALPAESLLWTRLSDTSIRVNLDAPLKLPFEGAKILWSESGSGWVTVEKRNSELYVDGKVVILITTPTDESMVTRGHDMRELLVGEQCLHPNILDALMENTHLMPNMWSANSGKPLFVGFWAVGFSGEDGRRYVRHLVRDTHGTEQWSWENKELGNEWAYYNPAAVVFEEVPGMPRPK